MQALTKLNPTDPVRFDGMNTILGEIEGRDEDLLNKINELSEADVDLLDKINVLESKKADKYYTNLAGIGLTDADMSDTDLGANIKKILDAMPINSEFKTYVYSTTPNLSKSIQMNSPSKNIEGNLFVRKIAANLNIPNRIEFEPNRTNGANTLEIGWYDNVWSGLKQVATTDITSELMSKLYVQYINTGTHTLSEYTEQGIYCFTTGCTITDIPIGVNGWLIVLPTNLNSPNVKQIWMRWGTPTTNSWMTYERVISGGIIGEWIQYATTQKIEIPFPFNVGFEDENVSTTSAQTSSVIKVNNEVEVIGNIRKTDKTVFAKGDIAMTLPSGYRPLKNLRISASCYPYGTSASLLIDKGSGNVIVQAVSSTNISVLSFIVKFNV